MSLYPDYPDILRQGEFALVRFSLGLHQDGCLTLGELLGLRPRLMATRCDGHERLAELFAPPLSADPSAVRRFQKPAPGCVFIPDPACAGDVYAGDRLLLEGLFLGTAIQSIGDMLAALQALGRRQGLGAGVRFDVTGAETLGPDGGFRTLWHPRAGDAELVPQLVRLDQWLERSWPARVPVACRFMTPARLVARGRVLRRPRFDQLFPFMLRRVTAMLYCWCGLEPITAPDSLLNAARRVDADWRDIRWVDWREAGEGAVVGGLTGTVSLDGSGVDELLWVVLLASLFGVGKGAAFGAGRFVVAPNADVSVS